MKRWSIVVYRGERSSCMGFSVSDSFLTAGVVFLSLFFAFFAYLAVEGYRNRSMLSHIIRLKMERDKLLRETECIMSSLEKLNTEIQETISRTSLLASLARRPIPDRYTLMMGTGGFPEKMPFHDQTVSSNVLKLKNETEKLKNILAFENKETDRAIRKLREKERLLMATPSIWPTYGRVTATFGWRRHPILKRREFHKGLDIANFRGTPIYATAYGRVTFTGVRNGYGYTVEIDHGYGFSTRYAHLKKILVRKGEYVKRGQLIGLMGATGLATGPHLHYEVRILGKAVNPIRYLDNSPVVY